MKAILMTLALLTLAEEVNASCIQDVNSRAFRDLQEREGGYSAQIDLQSDLHDAVTSAENLTLMEKREIEVLSRSPNHELYLVAATKGPLSYIDIVVVQRASCELARSYRIFSEE